jgi:hypothetical protein
MGLGCVDERQALQVPLRLVALQALQQAPAGQPSAE